MPETMGQRVRNLREQKRMSREALAARSGLSPVYIKMIELGSRVPERQATITALARALGVNLSTLLGTPYPIGDDGRPGHPMMPAVQEALEWRAVWETPASAELPDLMALRLRVDEAWDVWQSPGPFAFSHVGVQLPDLIRDVERAVKMHRGQPTEKTAQSIAVWLYLLVRPFVKHTGYPQLTTGVAERGLRYAEDVGDPALLGAATWNYCQALTSTERPEGALIAAQHGLEHIAGWAQAEDAPVDILSAAGALHLVAMVGAVRLDDRRESNRHLHLASGLARRVPDSTNYARLVFGPSNVAVHRVHHEVEQGNAGAAAQGSLQVLQLLDRMPSVERRVTLRLDAAYAHTLNKADPGLVMQLLEEADREAPERVVASAKARSTVQLILRRVGRSDEGRILPLARRLEVA